MVFRLDEQKVSSLLAPNRNKNVQMTNSQNIVQEFHHPIGLQNQYLSTIPIDTAKRQCHNDDKQRRATLTYIL